MTQLMLEMVTVHLHGYWLLIILDHLHQELEMRQSSYRQFVVVGVRHVHAADCAAAASVVVFVILMTLTIVH